MKNNLKIKGILRPLLFALAILANFYFIQNWLVGIIIALLLFCFYCQALGNKIFPHFDSFFQFFFSALSFVAANSIILWILFYLYQINFIVFIVLLFLELVVIEFFFKPKFSNRECAFSTTKNTLKKIKEKPALALYFVFIFLYFLNIFLARSENTIDSPWNLLSEKFFIYFIFASILLVFIILKNKNHKFSLLLVMLHFFSLSSVALVIYKIGYGYDAFLHFASIREILETGLLLPKPLYYIGAYSLIIFLNYISQIPIEFIIQALLPAVFSIFFPLSIYYGFSRGLKFEKKYTLVALLSSLILPVSYFITTTPQGLTNLLCLIIIFLSFISREKLSIYFLLFLSFLTITIHPLFGAPILLFVLYLYFSNFQNVFIRKTGSISVFCFSLIIFPLLFLINSLINGFQISLRFPQMQNLFAQPFLIIKEHYNFVFDSIFIYGFNYKLIFFFIVALAIILTWKNHDLKKFKLYIASGLILLFNFFSAKSILNFEFATNQDQNQFLDRIFELSMYFFLPLVIYLFYWFIKSKNIHLKFFVLICLIAIMFLSLYFSYPIKNDYLDSKQYNVTQSAIETVHLIADHADRDYAVLGNQMLAAAAIKEFGFKKYYGQQFYYSIPNNLENSYYQYYEKMVFDEPKLEYAQAAMNALEIDALYFVISDYWTNSAKIIEQAKLIALESFATSDNKNYIFYFEK